MSVPSTKESFKSNKTFDSNDSIYSNGWFFGAWKFQENKMIMNLISILDVSGEIIRVAGITRKTNNLGHLQKRLFPF